MQIIYMKQTDVVSIEKTNENFRLLYDTKGRFIAQKITTNEAKVFSPHSFSECLQHQSNVLYSISCAK